MLLHFKGKSGVLVSLMDKVTHEKCLEATLTKLDWTACTGYLSYWGH